MVDKNKVFQWVDSHSEEAVDLLKDLIRIPSVNPYFKDEVRLQKEGRIQEYLKNYIEHLSFKPFVLVTLVKALKAA